jgi:hypothetical protein
MELLLKIKEELKGYVGWSRIYQFDDSEVGVYKEIKDYLKEDSEFLDIVLDGLAMTDLLSKLEGKSDKFVRVNLRDYLFNKLYEIAGVMINYDEINLMPYDIDLDELNEELQRLAQCRDKKKCRIHVFLDEVPNEAIQTKINDIFTYMKITVIGYRSKDLLSYVDSRNERLEALYSYIPVSTDRCIKNAHERTRK